MSRFYGISLILLLCCTNPTTGIKIEGTISTFDNFYFLARFCFRPNNGKATFTFNYRRENVGGIIPTYNSLLMYYDGEKQWDAAYKTDITCDEKVALLVSQNDTDQLAELKQTEELYCEQEDNTVPVISCTSNWENKESVYSASDSGFVTFHNGYIGFQNSKARWWYFAISNCINPNGVTRMDYTVELTNGDSFWTKHVSADEIGILETQIGFLGLLVYLLVLTARVSVILAKKQFYHTSFKIYTVSVVFRFLATIAMGTSRVLIHHTGFEYKPIEYVGKGLCVLSDTCFILLLILLSKGWTVVKGRISTEGTVILSASVTFYLIAQIIALFWEAYMFDPGQVLYEYESAPGFSVMVTLVLMWIWFTSCTFNTLKNYQDKKTFYCYFYIAYTFWFLAKPIVVLLASFYLEDSYRERAVDIILNTNTFLAFSVFLVLTRPSNANKLFPFNVKTTQIGISVTSDRVVDAPAVFHPDRADMFKATGAVVGGRRDAYAVGFSSVLSNAQGIEMDQVAASESHDSFTGPSSHV